MGTITGLYQCPSCSRAITYRSEETRLNVCACGTVLNRLESDELSVRSVQVVTDASDLIRIGTKGVYGGRRFEVLGRVRVWLEESVCNYWTLLFEDRTIAWLAESYGLYSILRRVLLDKAVTIGELDGLKQGDSLELKVGSDYYYQRKDNCKKYEIEGEVWLPECRDTFPIYDLYAKGEKHIEIMELLPGYLVACAMEFTDFTSLQLTGLNETPPEPRQFRCTQCNSDVRVKTFPYAQSCSCVNCGARLVFSLGRDFRASSRDKSNNDNLSIPLGAKGVVKNIEFEVIGYALKQDNADEPSYWKEYVLYNRAEGYAFLSEYKGSWIYAREQGNSPVLAKDDTLAFTYHAEEFELYNSYSIRILDTAGEFPFNIYNDTSIVSSEYISPPRMWIYERSRQEGINWFLGEHIDREELLEQFPYDLPAQEEKGILDPGGVGNKWTILKITGVMIAIFILVHMGIGMMKDNRVLLDQDVQMADSLATTTFVSQPFELTRWRSNLEFDIKAPVDNSWIDMDAQLVNAKTGTEYAVSDEVSYYHGYDDGESWSEGGKEETAWLNSIPAGKYFLRVQASRDTTSGLGQWNGVRDFNLKVTNDVSTSRNFWIFLLFALIWPVIAFIRAVIRDRQRWSGSKYSPYK